MNRTGSHTLLALVVLCSASVVGVAVATGAGAAQTSCSFPVTETDATGTDVTIDEYPDRIVTLGGSSAQTIWEIGEQDRVVGITDNAQYLDGAGSKAVVGGYMTISTEQIVGLTPDVILAANTTQEETVAQLRQAGLTVYMFNEATSVGFIADKTELTGELIGSCQAGSERADEFRDDVETIKEAVDDRRPQSVIHILGSQGFAAGDNTFITEMIETAGGTNLASDYFDGYQPISTEVVLAENPQWITKAGSYDIPEYEGTTAVDEDQILTLEGNYVSQPAPRTIQPMVTMVEHWHPEAYENAQLADVSSDDGREEPQYERTLRSDGTAYLMVSHLRHDDPYVAEFSLPTGFGNQSDRAPSLTNIAVRPGQTDLAFRLYVSPANGNVTLPDDYEQVAGYDIRSGGLQPEDSANLTGTVEFNTTAREVAPDGLAAFGNGSGTWRQLPLDVQDRDTTLEAQFNATSFGTVYLATAGNDTAAPPSSNATGSGNGTATTNETATAVTPTANGTETPNATGTPTDQPQRAGPTGTPGDDVGTDQSGPGTESGAETATQAETTGSSGPGFGLVATLVAMVVLTVAAIHTSARRRP